MQSQEHRPELAHRLRQWRDVQFVRPDPRCLLDLLVMLAQRDAVFVPLREPKDALSVLYELAEGSSKKLARVDAAAKTSSRSHAGNLA